MDDVLTEEVATCPDCGSGDYKSLIRTPTHMHHAAEKFTFSVCGSCNAAFLTPRVRAAHLKKYYTSYYLPYRGGEAWGKYRPIVQKSQTKTDLKRVRTCLKYFEREQPISVLDVGCGRPTLLQALQKQTE